MFKLIKKVKFIAKNQTLTPFAQCVASHVARRLLTGVFKPSGYLNCTFSGQAPRAPLGQGKVSPVKALNEKAKNEIIDYALKLANGKKWTSRNGKPQTREDLKKAMSQKIGELKRTHLNKKQTLPRQQ